MKYFLLGAFASAILIYGMALTFGATGSFAFTEIGATLGSTDTGLLALAGSLLILIGLAFKLSFAPFHQWAPDVYVGASLPVTAFMSVVVKAAAFGAALRVVTAAWPGVDGLVLQGLAVLVAATLVVGNVGALVQPTVKRILAYSAVAHAGYLGLGLLAAHAGTVGADAVAWYLLAYTAMTAGAFAVAYAVSGDDVEADEVDRWRGLGAAKPGAAVAMTLFLASLAGIPPLAGFFGKFLVIQAAFTAGWAWLGVIALATAVVAVVYYGRIVIAIWRDGRLSASVTLPGRLRLAVVVSAVLVVAFSGLPAL
jgi:NADH-quinone oxidoreductase subunit N